MDVTLHHGLPSGLRQAGARLYWAAFGPKLGRVLGPEPLALAFLHRVIEADQCFVALDAGGGLLGIAGYKTTGGSFAGGTLADLRAVYGRWGAYWRGGLLLALDRHADTDCFLMDGICVSATAQGMGVGKALLSALYGEAARLGYPAIRLDVIDSNTRARALYDREGFVPIRTMRLGLLKHVFGFASTTTMIRPVASPSEGLLPSTSRPARL